MDINYKVLNIILIWNFLSIIKNVKEIHDLKKKNMNL